MSLERIPSAVSTFTRSNTRISCMCCGARAPYTDTPVDAPGAGLAITRTILRGLAWSFLWESKTKAGKRVSAWDADRRLVTRCPDCTHRLRPAPLEVMS